MKLIKIKFTAWRDDATTVPPELQAANDKLAGLAQRKQEIHAYAARDQELQAVQKTVEITERLTAAVVELDNVETARKAMVAAQEAAATAAVLDMKNHARARTFGYQVLTEDGSTVTAIVDEAGAALPAGAVYEYEVVDADPALPAWANVKGPA